MIHNIETISHRNLILSIIPKDLALANWNVRQEISYIYDIFS